MYNNAYSKSVYANLPAFTFPPSTIHNSQLPTFPFVFFRYAYRIPALSIPDPQSTITDLPYSFLFVSRNKSSFFQSPISNYQFLIPGQFYASSYFLLSIPDPLIT